MRTSLNWNETASFIITYLIGLKEERILRAFEKKVLRSIFGCTEEKVTRG
jgi:hypothetical protein